MKQIKYVVQIDSFKTTVWAISMIEAAFIVFSWNFPEEEELTFEITDGSSVQNITVNKNTRLLSDEQIIQMFRDELRSQLMDFNSNFYEFADILLMNDAAKLHQVGQEFAKNVYS